MQEYILKAEVMKVITHIQGNININRRDLHNEIDSLPTTVHHEYKVGEEYEFMYELNDLEWEWLKWELIWYWMRWAQWFYNRIRPVAPEHPDIIQARELLEKNWYSVTKI